MNENKTVARTMNYRVVQEQSIGVRPNDSKFAQHHAVRGNDEIIYSGSFEDCVRAIERSKAESKAAHFLIPRLFRVVERKN